MTKEDQGLLTKCEAAFAIASSMMYDPEINNMLDLFQRFKALESSRGILIPTGTLKVGDEIEPKIDLVEVEKLVIGASKWEASVRWLYNERTDEINFCNKLRERIGYSITDLPNDNLKKTE